MNEFKVKKSQTKTLIIIGIIIITISIIAMTLIGRPISLVFGILALILGLIQKDKTILAFYDNHLEMHIAPLRSLNLTKYSTINSIETINDKKIFLHYTTKTRVKNLESQ